VETVPEELRPFLEEQQTPQDLPLSTTRRMLMVHNFRSIKDISQYPVVVYPFFIHKLMGFLVLSAL
jgi:hypothetical protein